MILLLFALVTLIIIIIIHMQLSSHTYIIDSHKVYVFAAMLPILN